MAAGTADLGVALSRSSARSGVWPHLHRNGLPNEVARHIVRRLKLAAAWIHVATVGGDGKVKVVMAFSQRLKSKTRHSLWFA